MAVERATFGALLRRLRKAAGFTQAELAERAGLSVRGINDLERGARQTPRKDTVGLLAEALGLTEEERLPPLRPLLGMARDSPPLHRAAAVRPPPSRTRPPRPPSRPPCS